MDELVSSFHQFVGLRYETPWEAGRQRLGLVHDTDGSATASLSYAQYKKNHEMEIYSAGLIGRKLPFIERKHLGTGYVGTRPVYRPMDGDSLFLGCGELLTL